MIFITNFTGFLNPQLNVTLLTLIFTWDEHEIDFHR